MSGRPRIDESRQQQAREYGRVRRRAMLINIVVSAGFLLLLLVTGASNVLRDTAMALTGDRYAALGVYFAVFFIAYLLITLPIDFYRGFTVVHRFGLSTQSLMSWIFDWLKSTVLGFVLGLVSIEVLYLLLEFYPNYWWVPAAAGLVLFSVLLANLAPIILVPLFYKLEPLKDEELARRLTSLAERTGTKVRGVYTLNLSAKTTAANAALMGLGNTRRIVLGDTLLENFSADEIETVMAHELGHHVHSDIPKLIAVESVTAFVSLFVANLVLHWATATFGFAGVTDIAALPILVLALAVVTYGAMPFTNAFSRWVESHADGFALRVTRKPYAFISAMTRLANQNLAELQPANWVKLLLYDHPAIGDRIAMARRFDKARLR